MNDNLLAKLSVDELINLLDINLNQNFGLLRIFGEISNLTLASSGHWYFNLRGSKTLIRCVLFRNFVQTSGLTPQDGLKVEVEAFLGVYSPRGEIQLQIKKIRPNGEGENLLAYKLLKEKLKSEGLFDEARKKPMPQFPQTVGIITSLQTAALQDMLKVFREKSPHITVFVYRASVQGENACNELISALDNAEKHQQAKVLIISRGGGANEDLQAFNNEQLVRRIAKLAIPIISGIGHESDFTLCDLVCDFRAATPTAAANFLPQTAELQTQINLQKKLLVRNFRRLLNFQIQQIDYAKRIITNLQENFFGKLEMHLMVFAKRINSAISNQSKTSKNQLSVLQKQLLQARINYFETQTQKIKYFNNLIKTLDPSLPQKKGFVLLTKTDGTLIKTVQEIKVGEVIVNRFVDGIINSEVKKVIPD